MITCNIHFERERENEEKAANKIITMSNMNWHISLNKLSSIMFASIKRWKCKYWKERVTQKEEERKKKKKLKTFEIKSNAFSFLFSTYVVLCLLETQQSGFSRHNRCHSCDAISVGLWLPTILAIPIDSVSFLDLLWCNVLYIFNPSFMCHCTRQVTQKSQ